jgi:hypothetical protein
MYDLHVKPDYKYIIIPHECIMKAFDIKKINIDDVNTASNENLKIELQQWRL